MAVRPRGSRDHFWLKTFKVHVVIQLWLEITLNTRASPAWQ